MPGAKTELFGQWHGGNMVLTDEGESTGRRFWVDSGSATGADAGGYGASPDAPFLTLDYALGTNGATANQGDIIYLMPGHAETLATATAAAIDKAGVTIIGLGVGADRPTLTISTAATATVAVSVASVKIKNVLFVCGTDGINGGITVTGADFMAEDCEFRDAANVEADIWASVTAVRPTFRRCFFNGYVDGDQQESAISLNGATNALIEDCIFHGKYVTAAVSFDTACLGVTVRNSQFYSKTTTDFTKSVVDTATGSTWELTGCFDLGAGSAFAGGSGSALAGIDTSALSTAIGVVDEFHDVPAKDNALNAQINEVIGNKTDTTAAGAVTETDTLVGYVKQLVAAAIVAATSDTTAAAWDVRTVASVDIALDGGSIVDVFTVANGPVELLGLVVNVTEAVSANACNMSWELDPATGAANTAMCAVLDIASTAVGDALYITGASASALVKAANATAIPLTCATHPVLMPGGLDLILSTSDPTTGIGTAYLIYRPLSATAVVTAA